MKKLLVMFFILLSYFTLFATIIDIPADHSTIQEGINVAVNGDTILVQPGNYVENIHISEKSLVISSLFLTTQDSSYIAQTIIDGNQENSAVRYYGDMDSTSVLCGFTITNGDDYRGGGIYSGGTSTTYKHLLVTGNNSDIGGGMFLEFGNPTIENCIIENNFATQDGGGLYFWKQCNPILDNVVISSNSANRNGGGFFSIEYCNITLKNSLVINNSSNESGGGIYNGYYSEFFLLNTTICNNSALRGGGIYSNNYAEGINFDPIHRSNIYSNTIINNDRGFGADIFAYDCDVIVDTFTTLTPTDYYASPIANFSFDILNEIGISLINSELYVSVDGDDDNSGTTAAEPLKTIKYALSKIYSDSINTNTIHLAPGTYSSSTNGENFPIEWSNFVSLIGENSDNTILDAEDMSNVMSFNYVTSANIENLTITNGNAARFGGGIYCNHSDIVLENIRVIDNSAEEIGGGIFFSNSNPNMQNIEILDNNSAINGGGVAFYENSTSIIENIIIEGNSASLNGGGIFNSYSSNTTILDSYIENNLAGSNGGGIFCSMNSNMILGNVIINANRAEENGGGIICNSSSSITFDENNLCSIYLNYAGDLANDIFSADSMTVIVDTFTVAQPDDYFTYPIENFSFNISNDYITPVAQDLFVNPTGSNNNNGLTAASPMQTITFALLNIIPDSVNVNNIYLSNGTYNAVEIAEKFPINCRSFVSIVGDEQEFTILDGEDQYGLINCYQDSFLTISNLTITNGNRTNGGGINCSLSSEIDINNVTIDNNSAHKGAGLYCYYSSPKLNNVSITNNSGGYRGGGIYCGYHSNAIIKNSFIDNNYAPWGGGIIFRYNDGNSYMENVVISNNSASGGGGIICSYSNTTLENVTILNNSASHSGGGITCGRSEMILNNVLIKNNSAIEDGGGLHCVTYPDMEFANVIIMNNSAGEKGGGLYCRDDYQIDFENVTVANNQAYIGGSGIYCHNSSDSNLNIKNSIIWSNYISGATSAIWLSYSNIAGGWDGVGNISTNPLFSDSEDLPYLLQEDSPCVDAGNPNESYFDPEDNNNLGFAMYPSQGTIINDMGAYGGPNTEFWEYVSIDENEIIKPFDNNLYNFPNPFNPSVAGRYPSTTIKFSIQKDSYVDLSVYNIKGQKIRTLTNDYAVKGSYLINWDGKNDSGKTVTSGVYLYKLKVNNKAEAVNKCLLLK